MIVGRSSEREALSAFLDDVPAGPSVMLLEGEQGIGKSTLWGEGVERARTGGYRVLACRPTGSETAMSFVGLGDLFRDVPAAALEGLPAPQREALEVALLLRPRGARRPDPHAVSAATLRVLVTLAIDRPLIVAVDDLPGLDRATARVLWFVVRRVSDEAIGFLLTRSTVGEPLPPEIGDALAQERVRRLLLRPFTAEDLAPLVQWHTGLSLSVPEARRLAEISGGNPFFALEIARAILHGDRGVTGQALPIPRNLRDDLIRKRLSGLPAKSTDLLLTTAAAVRPTLDLLRSAGGGERVRNALQHAIDAGIVEVVGLEVRFTHPLYRSAIYGDASRARRHAIHRRLADLTTDPEERARHLALSADGSDEGIAEALEEAAALARDRGAPDASAELLEHAIRLTPPEAVPAATRRHLEAADTRFLAGDPEAAGVHARDALRMASPGAGRAEARRRIAAVELERGAIADARAMLEAALAEPGMESGASAEILRDLASLSLRSGDLLLAERQARTGLEHAERSGDRELLMAARTTLARVSLLRGDPTVELPSGRTGPERTLAGDAPHLVIAEGEVFAGAHAMARDRLEALLNVAADRGDEPGRRTVLVRLAELEIRDGSWERAAALAEEARRLAKQLGLEDVLELGLLAYVNAVRGRLEEARAGARLGLEQAGDDRFALLWSLGALGELELSLGQSEQAVHHLGRAGGIATSMGLGDPAALPFLPDEAEALILVGELARADERIVWLEERSETLGRTSALAAAARCRGLARGQTGDLAGALTDLERSTRLYETLPLPFEHARALLALGVHRRRDRQKRLAREAIERALQLFTELGAAIWSERARGELARISGRRASLTELTESEARVVRLAASGLTNREIARTLSMSVRTVEGHLSHAYAKLGLRSRTELAVFSQGSD